MIRTLKQNKAPAKLGGIQHQADNKSPAAQMRANPENATKTKLDDVVTVKGGRQKKGNSLLDVVQTMKSEKGAIIPHPAPVSKKHTMPDPHVAQFKIDEMVSDVKDNPLVLSNHYEPYEQLNGITKDRPEIIMMSDFLPLYDYDSSGKSVNPSVAAGSALFYRNFMSIAGHYFEDQMTAAMIKQANLKKLMAQISSTQRNGTGLKDFSNKLKNTAAQLSLKEDIDRRKTTLGLVLDELKKSSDFLFDLIMSIEDTKDKLDLRHSIFMFSPKKAFQVFCVSSNINLATTLPGNFSSENYDVVSILRRYGFDDSYARNSFTSTKLWLQLIYQLKQQLAGASKVLLEKDTAVEKSDSSPGNILLQKKLVDYSFKNKQQNDLITLDEFFGLTPADIQAHVSKMKAAYDDIYYNLSVKSVEDNIVILSNLISKEVRFSRGDNSFNFASSNWDDFFGETLSTIISPKTSQNLKSLENVAITHDVINGTKSVKVLNLEQTYIEGSNEIITPGSVFNIENVLRSFDGESFDVTRLENFKSKIEDSFDRVNNLVYTFNMLGIKNGNSNFENPLMLFNSIKYAFFDKNADFKSNLGTDSIFGLFAAASSDNVLRSLLFTYFFFSKKALDKEDLDFSSTIALRLSLVERIIKRLKETITADVSPQFADLTLENIDEETLSKELLSIFDDKSDSKSLVVERVAQLLFSTHDFLTSNQKDLEIDVKTATKVIENNITRFSSYKDTVFLMLYFDLIVHILTALGGKNFVGRFVRNNKLCYGVNVSTLSSKRNSSIMQRLNVELTTQSLSFLFIWNTLLRLKISLTELINKFTSKSASAEMKKISSLFDDPDNLKLLLNKQQIMMFCVNARETIDILKNGISDDYVVGDPAANSPFTRDAEINTLDDALIGSKLRDAVLTYFSQKSYATSQARNKKIMSVGIPIGFSEHLRRKIAFKDLKKQGIVTKKQEDLVLICVYKIDLQNQDLVFKPMKFMFELSRFPVRNIEKIKLANKQAALNATDVIASIPTKNVRRGDLTIAEQYYPGFKGFPQAFGTDDYSFLTKDEHARLHLNHVTSFLLESYIKIMTGVSTSDYHFDIETQEGFIEEAFGSKLVDNVLNISNTPAEQIPNGVQEPKLFSNNLIQRNLTVVGDDENIVTALVAQEVKAGEKSIATMSYKSAAANALQALSTLSQGTSQQTSISDPNLISKRLIGPKLFDRVFNIIFDQDEFLIDYEKTIASPQGKAALEQLKKTGEIVETKTQTQAGDSPFDNYKKPDYVLLPKSKDEGDLLLNRFIVTVETFEEAGVI